MGQRDSADCGEFQTEAGDAAEQDQQPGEMAGGLEACDVLRPELARHADVAAGGLVEADEDGVEGGGAEGEPGSGGRERVPARAERRLVFAEAGTRSRPVRRRGGGWSWFGWGGVSCPAGSRGRSGLCGPGRLGPPNSRPRPSRLKPMCSGSRRACWRGRRLMSPVRGAARGRLGRGRAGWCIMPAGFVKPVRLLVRGVCQLRRVSGPIRSARVGDVPGPPNAWRQAVC